MLKQIKIRNFKNFRDEIVFSLDTPNNYEFNSGLIENNIIKMALVIGENACGKSNLCYGIMDLVNHLTDNASKGIRAYANLYNEDTNAYFEYTFEFAGNILVYKYEKKTPVEVIREEILINNKSVLMRDFDKEYVYLKGAENLNLGIIKDKKLSLVKYVYANTILDESDVCCRTFEKFISYVNGMLCFSSTEGNKYIGFTNERGNLFEAIAQKENGVAELEAFLKSMGIEYSLFPYDNGENLTIYCRMGGREVALSSVISSGTRSLIFFFYWYMQIEKVSFLIVDEYDAFYHTDLSKRVIELIKKVSNVQAVITTHNTDLISNEILRPDCIFLLKNNKLKTLTNLTDKSLREAHNLQKMYKAGAFNE